MIKPEVLDPNQTIQCPISIIPAGTEDINQQTLPRRTKPAQNFIDAVNEIVCANIRIYVEYSPDTSTSVD